MSIPLQFSRIISGISWKEKLMNFSCEARGRIGHPSSGEAFHHGTPSKIGEG